MSSKLKSNFRSNYFFIRLKKGDSFYYQRLNDRFKTIRENAIKLSKATEQEMFISYLKLMELSFAINDVSKKNNGIFRQ